ncbi:MAG: hypothetical protein ABF274_13335 [Nonlabens sp.]|jgi:hypothetical protein|uniref:hypothetical protein n=1 Tax=Nonlabens sp. TaxID=1888209 RepID=UPI00321A8F99
MNIKLFFIVLFIATMGYSQYTWTDAVVTLKNGTVLTGEAQIPMQNKGIGSLVKFKERVKFRKEKGGKKTKHDIKNVKEISFNITYKEKIDGKRVEKTRIAKYVPVVYKKKRKKDVACFMEEIVIGTVSLYGRSVNAQGSIGPMSQAGTNIPMYHNFWMSHNEFYVQKNNEQATLINQVSLSKAFKKRAAEYFKSCPSVVTKVEAKELKKSDLKEIVELYNENCG